MGSFPRESLTRARFYEGGGCPYKQKSTLQCVCVSLDYRFVDREFESNGAIGLFLMFVIFKHHHDINVYGSNNRFCKNSTLSYFLRDSVTNSMQWKKHSFTLETTILNRGLRWLLRSCPVLYLFELFGIIQIGMAR